MLGLEFYSSMNMLNASYVVPFPLQVYTFSFEWTIFFPHYFNAYVI